MTGYFLAAAAASLFGCGFHLIVGSRVAVKPLLAVKGLTPASRWLNFLCWHLVSLWLGAMAAGFLWAGIDPAAREVAIFLTAIAAASAALTLYVCWRARFRPWRLPPFILFVVVSICGVLGLPG